MRWFSLALAAAVVSCTVCLNLSAARAQASDPFGEEATLTAKPIVYLKGTGTWDNAFETITNSFKTLKTYVAKEGLKIDGQAMTIFTATDDTGFQFQAAIPVADPPKTPPKGEIGVGDKERLFDRVRQRQHRHRREQHLARHRHDRADCARLIRWLAVVVAGWLLVGLNCRVRRDGLFVGDAGLAPKRSRSLCGVPMEMPERQHELQRQREQRQPRTRFDMSPEPLHGITDVTL